MMTNIIGVEPTPENLPIDLPVEVTWEQQRRRHHAAAVPPGRRRRMSLRMSAAIVGAAETDVVGVQPDKSAIQLHAEAAFNALADAGLTKDDIDGVLCAGQSPVAGRRVPRHHRRRTSTARASAAARSCSTCGTPRRRSRPASARRR